MATKKQWCELCGEDTALFYTWVKKYIFFKRVKVCADCHYQMVNDYALGYNFIQVMKTPNNKYDFVFVENL